MVKNTIISYSIIQEIRIGIIIAIGNMNGIYGFICCKAV